MGSPLLVVGSFVQDLTFFVDRFPSAGETLLGRFAAGPGGKGSNQAVAAARAGAKTAFAGAVGNDGFGDGAERFLAGEGIEQQLLRIADAATGTAGITVNGRGENQIVVALGASERFAAAQVDPAWLAGAEILVLQCEIALQTVADLLKMARALGKTTIFNPAPLPVALDLALLMWVDILIPNETEFVGLVRRFPGLEERDFSEERLAALEPAALQGLCRKLGVPTVIVTLGSRGCFISQAEGYEWLPACQEIEVVDTTGAGDAFVGGFAAGLLRFAGDVGQAARFGTVVAGLSVTRRGTAPAMPMLREIEAVLGGR